VVVCDDPRFCRRRHLGLGGMANLESEALTIHRQAFEALIFSISEMPLPIPGEIHRFSALRTNRDR
jgi:hypothetical protein